MAWVKIDDGFYDHPKMRAAGKDGRALLGASLCHASAQLTDGLISDHDLPLVAAKAEVRPKPTAARLVEVGVFHRAGHECDRCPWCPDGAYLIHEYHVYQPSAEQERLRRRELSEVRSKAGKAGAEARWGNGKPNGKPMAQTVAQPRQTDGPVPVPVPTDVGKGVTTGSPVTPTGSRSLALDLAAARHPATPSPAGFDEFWAVYPVRKAKGAARVAWSKAVKRAPVGVIVEGARRYASDPERDPDYTCNPATWLNADRWEDEPVARPLKVSKSSRAIAGWLEATT